MSSLNCAIINCCKITRTELVCFKGDVADLATNNAPLAYFNAANEDRDSNTSVLLNKGKTSSSHIPQKYSYQCTECKFRKKKDDTNTSGKESFIQNMTQWKMKMMQRRISQSLISPLPKLANPERNLGN